MTGSSSDEPVRILLVEDNPGDVRLIKEAFESIECDVDFHVLTDGEAAVKYAKQQLEGGAGPRPDIILLDLNLPRMDGFGVLEILHEELETPPPPILVLSSSADVEDINESYRKGCNAYLTKPSNMGELTSMARSIKHFWLDRARPPQLQP